jgi:CO/xanthine dehydrogenase FAD-binding subunit
MALTVEPPMESPRTLAEAYALLADGRAWRPIAGGTDLMVELAAGRGEPPERMLDLSAVAELHGVQLEPRALVIGAGTTYAELRRSALAGEVVPALLEAAATVGAVQIQTRGTLGGNLATASPAGDTLPVLLALDAEVVLGGPRGERTVPIDRFFVAYREIDLATDELIIRVRIPIVPGREARFQKVGTRRAQAIAKVSIALAWREGPPDDDPGRPLTNVERPLDDRPPDAWAHASSRRVWRGVRVALGSVAATPIRAAATEAALEGATPTLETADRAAETLAAELQPIDDVRSTAAYRRVVAARVLHRLVREAGGW